MKKDPYEVLKIDKNSSVEEIVDAYYKIMFDGKSTYIEKDQAYRAFRMLLDPNYQELLNNIETKREAA